MNHTETALEANFEDAATEDLDSNDDGDFEFVKITEKEKQTIASKCPYIKELLEITKLEILQPDVVQSAYATKELGLFHLFLRKSMFESILKWTNEELERKGQSSISMGKFNAYVGLEIAMSIIKLNDISDYWCKNMFLGQSDFANVMSQENFESIRESLRFYPKSDHELASVDPLWHSRIMLEHFMKQSANIAVPRGVSSLDEKTLRCKAEKYTRTFTKNKPNRYGIRFYAIVSWFESYLHTFWDNGFGNKTGVPTGAAYCRVFRDLRGLYNDKFEPRLVQPSRPSALWCLQMAHQTKRLRDPSGKRLIVTDNIFTRHIIAKQTENLTDGEIKMIGTVNFINIDGVNRRLVKKAMDKIQNCDRGSWILVQAFNKTGFGNEQSITLAQNTGYIVFKDRAVVVFYTNDLSSTPSQPLQGCSEESIMCVRGIVPLNYWFSNGKRHQTVVQVPGIIVAYNIFMNGVDRFDQYRSTNATEQREKRVTMRIFTFLLDAAMLNAYAIQGIIDPKGRKNLREFKTIVAQMLVQEHLRMRNKKRTTSSKPQTEEPIGCIVSRHVLLENQGKKSASCYLCSMMVGDGKERTSIYGCSQCKRAFHVNCFAFYHFEHALTDSKRPILQRLIRENDGASTRKKRRDRKITSASNLSNARLPFPY